MYSGSAILTMNWPNQVCLSYTTRIAVSGSSKDTSADQPERAGPSGILKISTISVPASGQGHQAFRDNTPIHSTTMHSERNKLHVHLDMPRGASKAAGSRRGEPGRRRLGRGEPGRREGGGRRGRRGGGTGEAEAERARQRPRGR